MKRSYSTLGVLENVNYTPEILHQKLTALIKTLSTIRLNKRAQDGAVLNAAATRVETVSFALTQFAKRGSYPVLRSPIDQLLANLRQCVNVMRAPEAPPASPRGEPTAEQRQAWAEALTRLDDHSKTMIKMASRHDTEAFLASARDTTRLAKQLLDQLVAGFARSARVGDVTSACDALRVAVRNAVTTCRSGAGNAFMSGVDLDAALAAVRRAIAIDGGSTLVNGAVDSPAAPAPVRDSEQLCSVLHATETALVVVVDALDRIIVDARSTPSPRTTATMRTPPRTAPLSRTVSTLDTRTATTAVPSLNLNAAAPSTTASTRRVNVPAVANTARGVGAALVRLRQHTELSVEQVRHVLSLLSAALQLMTTQLAIRPNDAPRLEAVSTRINAAVTTYLASPTTQSSQQLTVQCNAVDSLITLILRELAEETGALPSPRALDSPSTDTSSTPRSSVQSGISPRTTPRTTPSTTPRNDAATLSSPRPAAPNAARRSNAAATTTTLLSSSSPAALQQHHSQRHHHTQSTPSQRAVPSSSQSPSPPSPSSSNTATITGTSSAVSSRPSSTATPSTSAGWRSVRPSRSALDSTRRTQRRSRSQDRRVTLTRKAPPTPPKTGIVDLKPIDAPQTLVPALDYATGRLIDWDKELVLNDDGSVKGGSLAALLARLHADSDPHHAAYVQVFMRTFRAFVDSARLLSLLQTAYKCLLPEDTDTTAVKTEKKRHRLRIGNALKKFVEECHDEQSSKALNDDFVTFVESSVFPHDDTLALTLKLKYFQRLSSVESTVEQQFSEAPPKPLLPKSGTRASIHTLDPIEFARQLTLLDSQLLAAIGPFELIGTAWTKPGKETNSKNLLALIHRFNVTSRFVVSTLVHEKVLKTRALLWKKFIKTADECRRLNNFNSMFAIVAGLNSAPCFRLHKTKALVSSEKMAICDELNELASSAKSYKKYREVLHTRNPPCVPFTGVYQTDLMFIEQGNKDLLPNGLINFQKCRQAADVIREVLLYQQPYNLVAVASIQNYLRSKEFAHEYSDEELFDASLQCEPRA